MFTLDTNSAKVKKFHRLSGRLSAFCWWATILMFLIHMGFCFEKPQVGFDVMYPDSLVKNPVIIVTIAFLHWLLLSALYLLFGRAILKRNLKHMTMIASAAIVLPIIRFILLRGHAVNAVWDILCWALVLLWIVSNKWLHKSENNFLTELIFFVLIIACVFIRDYYGNVEINNFTDFLGIYSFVFQDIIRSLAMIFLGIWFLTMPRESAV